MVKMLAMLSVIGLAVSLHTLARSSLNVVETTNRALSSADMRSTRGAQEGEGTSCTAYICSSPPTGCINDGMTSDSWVYFAHWECQPTSPSDVCNAIANLVCSTHYQFSDPSCQIPSGQYSTEFGMCGE